MKVGVIGTGYVGLTTGVCLSSVGHEVTCIDLNTDTIVNLRRGLIPIYEPGLTELLVSAVAQQRIKFSTSYNDLKDCEVLFVCVGTPENADKSANLSYIFQVADTLKTMINEQMLVVIKSTVPVGTTRKFYQRMSLGACIDFKLDQICFNPEFLKEGKSVEDFLNPDRIIIGCSSSKAFKKMEEVYAPIIKRDFPIFSMQLESAELVKYASNCFLATKISFINEIARFCDVSGADIDEVKIGLGKDRRIGSEFLNAGIGYGGSCFPKDVSAMLKTASDYDLDLNVISAADKANALQLDWFFKKIESVLKDLQGKKISLLGLSFKSETDDIRCSRSLDLTSRLLDRGASLSVFDPKGQENYLDWAKKQKLLNNIVAAKSIDECLKNADAVIVATEWKEFSTFDWNKALNLMKHPIVFDGRNLLDSAQIKKLGINYIGVGRNR